MSRWITLPAIVLVFIPVFLFVLLFNQSNLPQQNTGEEKALQQTLRKWLLSQMCAIAKGTISAKQQTFRENYENFIVDDTHKLIYCYVPKVACTNWKRFMYVLKKGKPYIDPASVKPSLVHGTRNLTYLSNFSPEIRKMKLMNYTKFMIVRDPFVRLISAFRSKFDNKSHNEVFYRNYGKFILKRYGNQPNPPQTMKKASALGLLPTFKNFVQYLVDPETEKMVPFEPHWRQMHRLCYPCLVKYDFIGHQETLQEDVQEILKMLKVENDINFPPFYQNVTTSNFIKDWFKTVSLEDRKKLYKIYKWDFKLFGYRTPNELFAS